MRALIIVDMLNDFVDEKLANPKAQAIEMAYVAKITSVDELVGTPAAVGA